MAKNNPNRLELLDFINQATAQLNSPAKKIEDLSSGVQYLHLLHQTHPQLVKMNKVNLKASHEYEFVNNLRLLAAYLLQVRAPFTFQVQKVAQRNYQENLNLIKNLYKFHYFSKQNKQAVKPERKTSVSIDFKNEVKSQFEKKKPIPKLIAKPQKLLSKTLLAKKHESPAGSLKGMLGDTKNHAEQQLKKILIVVKNEQKQLDQTAEAKLKKIAQILGINAPTLTSKKKKPNQQIQKTISSIKCEPSLFSQKKNVNLESDKENNSQKLSNSQAKKQLSKIQEQPQTNEKEKNYQKKFDCEEIKQSVLRRYELRLTSNRKSGGRLSISNLQNWIKEDDQEDTTYNENLLSPGFQVQQEKREKISRKSILKQSRNSSLNSLQKINNLSFKKVHFDSEKKQSDRKKSSGKKITEVRGQLTIKSSQKPLERSQKKETINS